MIHFKGCYPNLLPFPHSCASNPDAKPRPKNLYIKVDNHVYQDLVFKILDFFDLVCKIFDPKDFVKSC